MLRRDGRGEMTGLTGHVCGGGPGTGGRAVPAGPAGGSGLAIEHAELVVDGVGGRRSGRRGRAAQAVVLNRLLLGRGNVAENTVD